MDERNNLNNNLSGSDENTNHQDVEHISSKDENTNASVPYSFWAEQITSSQKEQKDDNENIFSHTNNNTAYDSNENIRSSMGYAYNNEANREVYDNLSNNKKKGFFSKLVTILSVALVFGVVAGATFIGVNALYQKINPGAPSLAFNFKRGLESIEQKLNLDGPEDSDVKLSTTTVSENIIQQKTDITDVVEATMPSIVTIKATFTETYEWFGRQFSEPNEGSGSGIIVGKNDKELLIATNNHVVEGANPIQVTFIDDTTAEAIIKGTDSIADLAVISIDISTINKETLDTIKIANLGDSDSVKVGQMAIAIGNALGYGQSVTVGYISAKDREVRIDNNTMVLLQTDAAINPGNSGGALLNTKGEVIGINTVKYASQEVEGMGYAIPISRAVPIINELMSREILSDDEKGYLGVYIQPVTEDVAKAYNWPLGVYVIEVVKGGSADRAGIVAGDIITKVNGMEVTATTQLQEKISSYRAGTEVELTIMRMTDGKYKEREVTVTLVNRKIFEQN